MKKEITYDELDAMLDRFDKAKYKCGNWWPSLEEIKQYIEPDIKNKLEFALWISETATEPITDEDKIARQYLNKLINNNLQIKGDKS